MSLNMPAIALLDGVGPAQLMARMRRAGAKPRLPPGRAPGLAIGLGGVGLTLTDLVQVYAGIARGGEAIGLRVDDTVPMRPRQLLSPVAAWQVIDVLAGTPAPVAASNGRIAYKPGPSYGHRDAWGIGFDGQHVIGVWVGRPDAAPIPGITGGKTAAPLLFEAFGRLKPQVTPFAPPPRDALVVPHADLPHPLRQFHSGGSAIERSGPEIIFPPHGAKVALGRGQPLALKIRDGRPPFTWLVNGEPVATAVAGAGGGGGSRAGPGMSRSRSSTGWDSRRSPACGSSRSDHEIGQQPCKQHQARPVVRTKQPEAMVRIIEVDGKRLP